MNHAKHALGLVQLVRLEERFEIFELELALLRVLDLRHLGLGDRSDLFQPGIQGFDDFFQGAGQSPRVTHIPDDLLPQPMKPRRQLHQAQLFQEVVAQIHRLDRCRLEELLDFVLLPSSTGVEAVEQDFLPVDFVLIRWIFSGFLAQAYVLLDVGLRHLQERILRQLLLEMLLQVQQGHVEQLHRLIQAWVDLHLLLELLTLEESGVESAHE